MRLAAQAFHLIDLASQAEAVQKLLSGSPFDEKIEWLAAHGSLSLLANHPDDSPRSLFESPFGFKCVFFITDDVMTFFADNTTWSVPRRRVR